ncbi:ATP-binding protein [Leptospira levettii]|uniref:ATP-binding protein n=1 Tax=Leptospira levettii TaxID=2023178 RepID=UPI0010832766|nr:ATP-binding protein [Leptospira levettii]TGM26214.1 ATP-binding protein [Leptospira levettii]
MENDFNHIRNQTIGTVEFVSPREIKVLLEINAPQSTAINTGVPQLFPKVNGFILIPNESGALVGIISWVGIEHSPYPKRKGYKDFDLIDLPFPLRKLSISPLGVLKESDGNYEIERGVYSYPSVGDIVVVPNQAQLRAIVQNKDRYAKVKIGHSSMAANAPVYINPDRIFGRHIAVLGNTGSGKSCSVAGLIRWSLEAAQKEVLEGKKLNSRFIVLDPNGEYGNTFDDLCTVRKFQVIFNQDSPSDPKAKQLKVPSWMWNSYEWSSIAQASGKTQRPLLRQTLREVRYGGKLDENDSLIAPRRFLVSILVSLRNFERQGITAIASWPGKDNLGEILQTSANSLTTFLKKITAEPKDKIESIIATINTVLKRRPKSGNYYPAFELIDIQEICNSITESQNVFGELKSYQGPDEDSPVYFNNEDFLSHIERLTQENNAQSYMDFFMMRVKSILTDSRIATVIETTSKEEMTLEGWLNEYIGHNGDTGSINIIDLSLLPSEILFVIVSVLSRIIFEAHQRFRRMTNSILPTTLVVEEAHNFIKRYDSDSDEITANKLCSQSFEKIAKEGRKFGLGLMLSSQRPSELSQTVLSQCNSFLLHRLVNDKDQEMVKKLVPDNLGSILNELPILPTKKAILLGWAAPIPIIVEMNTLEDKDRPKSKDPDFWDVWIGKQDRDVNWKDISDEWQNEKNL